MWNENEHPREKDGKFTDKETAYNSQDNFGNLKKKYIEDKPIDIEKVFGKEFKGYKGQEAINKLLKEKQGHIKGAFHREDMGDIDLVWGNEFCGLKHIIKRREEEKTGHAEKVLSKLSETITNATFRKRNKYGNFEFVYKKDNIQYFVIIAPEYHNKKMTYVLTAFNRYKK